MKKELIYLLAGVLLGVAYGTYRKRRGRVIVDRINKITEKQYKRSVGFIKDIV